MCGIWEHRTIHYDGHGLPLFSLQDTWGAEPYIVQLPRLRYTPFIFSPSISLLKKGKWNIQGPITIEMDVC
jgi:hypothetical protein